MGRKEEAKRLASSAPWCIGGGMHRIMFSWPKLAEASSEYRAGVHAGLGDALLLLHHVPRVEKAIQTLEQFYAISVAYLTALGGSAGPLSAKQRFAVLKRDGYRCQLCGAAAADASGIRLHVDHKHARIHGGTNDDINLWTLCAPCNQGKGTQTL